MTRVLIVDDHPIVLQGCQQLLADAGVSNIVQAKSATEGFQLYRAQTPDVIIVDLSIRANTLNGLSFIRRLRLHDQKVPLLVFTMHSDPVVVSRALELGATGYLLKDAPPDEFVKAFQRVRDGKTYLSHEIASDVAFRQAKDKSDPIRQLTLRELEMLALIAEGKTYSFIADHLNVSYKTVANTAAKLKAKLGAHTLSGLMRLAIEHFGGKQGDRRTPEKSPKP